MLLAIDVGNTNMTYGLFDNHSLLISWRMSTGQERTSDETGLLVVQFLHLNGYRADQVHHVILCSVVPHVMHSLNNAILKYLHCEPVPVGPGVKTSINIKYENPREVGADKIVNAVAALHIYGGPLIIVDFGTATTFCAISGKRDYIGGIICPGIRISADALFEKASKLPRVEIVKPRYLIGKTTVTSMQSGLVHGFVGQVDYIVDKMKEEMVTEWHVAAAVEEIKVVATGGMSRLIGPESTRIQEVNPTLILEGLRIIHEMNDLPVI